MKTIRIKGYSPAVTFKARFRSYSLGLVAGCLGLAGLGLGAPFCAAKTLYVNGDANPNPPPDGLSWATAFTNVGNALSAAGVGDEVWVAAGIYTNKKTLTLKSGVALYGGFDGSETNLNQRNWSAHTTTMTVITAQGADVITFSSGTNETRIDGFTILGDGLGGHGISCLTKVTLVVANNRIVNNRINSGDGAGIDCQRAGMVVITNNVIARNGPRSPSNSILGGGIHIQAESGSIVNNVIIGNSAMAGGGIMCASGNILVAGNTILGNETTVDGAGITCSSGSYRIIGNRILNNTVRQPRGGVTFYGGGGLSVFSSSSVIAANNLFLNNEVIGLTSNMDGGGILCAIECSAKIINNTLVGNRADHAGGAIHCFATNQPVLANNLIYSNSSGVVATTNTFISHNCVFGNGTNDYAGVPDPTGRDGNISRDPNLLVVPDFGTVFLRPDSPCRDAGDSTLVQADWTDVDGMPRILGAAVDIGAHESDGVTWEYRPVVARVSPEGDDANDGSSWALAKRNVQAAVDMIRLKGGEVWVKAGLYEGRIQSDAFGYLYGGFAGNETNSIQRNSVQNETILDARGKGSVVVFNGAASFGGLLDGFTIQNGLAESGGGILIGGSSPRIAHNLIRQNQARRGGGIMVLGNSSPAIIANRIVGNAATLTASSSKAYVKGGGVYQEIDPAAPYTVLIDNLIADNQADDSGRPGQGGGICCCGGSFKLLNNSIIRNVCLQDGTNNPSGLNPGNTFFEGCRATPIHPAGLIENNIIGWSSGGLTESALGNDPLAISNNCFFANAIHDYYGPRSPMGANGNLVADPLLVENDGLPRLQSASPCIDAGDDAAVDPAEPDLAGGRRLVGSHVDIGAVEFPSAVIRLKNVQWAADTGIRFDLAGEAEIEFVIQTSSDLRSWEPVTTNRCGAISIALPPAGEIDQRYFRAVVR